MRKITFIAALLVSISAFSQKAAYMPAPVVPPHRTCGTMEMDSIVRANDPSMGTAADFEIAIQQVISNLQQQRTMMPQPYNIPMIVHVIHNGTAVGTGPNISQAQIYSQFDVLNEDYNNTNADGSLVPAAFQPLRGSLQMNFNKALRDPSGNTLAEPGINRINRNTMGWNALPYSDVYMNSTVKPASIWDPTKYFNVWVVELSGGILGYAQFPPQPTPPIGGLPAGGASNTDGVVVTYTAFGRVGNVASPYNKGRTLTHEAGHFFGLRHIWGDEAACAADDYVGDTPQQKDKNYSCPTYPQTTQAGGRCNTGDPSSMFMNYMDYTDDACMYMFSVGQATRMDAVLSSSPRRFDLTTSNTATPLNGLDASISAVVRPTGSSCVGAFTPIVTLSNLGSTTLTSVVITYNIDGGTPVVYTWTGSLASGNATNVTLASATTSVGAHTFNVATSSPNAGTDANTANDSKSQAFTITTTPATTALPLVEGFTSATFPPTGWTLLNPDANNTWSRVTNAGGFGNSTNSAKMDNFSGSVNIAGQTDDLLTPVMNLSTANSTLKMVFNVAHAMYSASYIDSLLLEVSTDCGASWTRLYSKGGTSLATAPNATAAFTPTATQWRRDSVMLGAYAGQAAAQFRFRSYSGFGNNVYIDDINLNFTPTSTPPVANFTGAPTTVCAGGSVAFTDQSTNSPTSWSWSFPGGTPSTSTSQNPTVVYSTAGTYNVVLIATNGAGNNTMTKTNYITVNALPSTAATANPTAICVGNSSVLSATGANTYSWSPSGTLSASTGASVTATPTTTTTYTVTGTGSNGCVKTSTVSVTVNPLPTVSVTPAASTICPGGSTTLNVSGVTSATWSPSSGLSSTSGLSVTASPTSTQTYTITGTSSAGCVNTTTAVVNVSGALTVTISPTTVVMCQGSAATLTASGATTYSWSPSTGLSATTGATVTAGPSSTITYTVTGTSGSCTATATRIVTVNPNPSVMASGSTTICAGSAAVLSASGAGAGGSYTWNPGAQSGTPLTVTPTTTTTYTVTGTNTNGCKGTSTAVVTVNPLPTVTVTPSSSAICAGGSTTLNASGAATATWSPSSGLSSTSGLSVVASPTSTQTYTVTGTSSAGCVNYATAIVTVNTALTVTISPTTVAMCQGSAATLTASGATTYVWSPSTGLSGTTGATVTAGPSSTMTYTVTGTSGSCTGTATRIVTINPNPTITATGSTTICAGSPAVLAASGAGAGGTYTWNPGAQSGTPLTVTPASTTTYTVTGTNSNGCKGTSTAVVTVNPLPSTTAAATPSTICAGSSTTLNVTGASTYSWSPAGTLSSSTGATVTATPTSTMTYTVTGTSTAGCVKTATVSVTVNAIPNVVATAGSTSICNGSSTLITATGGSTFNWSPSGSLSSSTAPTVTATPTATTTYTVSGTMNGCTGSTTIVINVSTNPTIAVTPPSTTICSGSSTTLAAAGATTYNWSPSTGLSGTTGSNVTASPAGTTTYTVTGTSGGCVGTGTAIVTVTPNPTAGGIATPDSTSVGSPISFTNTSTNATSYSWNFGDGNTSTASDPVHTYGASGVYTVIVTASNGGCSSVFTLLVEVTEPNGIAKVNGQPVNIYPNPTSGEVNVTFGYTVPESFTITDAIGNVVLMKAGSELSSKITFDLSHLAKGVYFARIQGTDKAEVLRIVLN